MPKKLNGEETNSLLQLLEKRFEAHPERHPDTFWKHVRTRLEANPAKLWSISEMERSGGEPDVVEFESNADKIYFVDCSKESPVGRRSFCYDIAALNSRKANKPDHSAEGFAKEMQVELLNEEQYYFLQTIGAFDLKTSSWIETPAEMRKLGGALFCDRRFNRVFTYQNGAESYYAARGFRAILAI